MTKQLPKEIENNLNNLSRIFANDLMPEAKVKEVIMRYIGKHLSLPQEQEQEDKIEKIDIDKFISSGASSDIGILTYLQNTINPVIEAVNHLIDKQNLQSKQKPL